MDDNLIILFNVLETLFMVLIFYIIPVVLLVGAAVLLKKRERAFGASLFLLCIIQTGYTVMWNLNIR